MPVSRIAGPGKESLRAHRNARQRDCRPGERALRSPFPPPLFVRPRSPASHGRPPPSPIPFARAFFASLSTGARRRDRGMPAGEKNPAASCSAPSCARRVLPSPLNREPDRRGGRMPRPAAPANREPDRHEVRGTSGRRDRVRTRGQRDAMDAVWVPVLCRPVRNIKCEGQKELRHG